MDNSVIGIVAPRNPQQDIGVNQMIGDRHLRMILVDHLA
jgi:hypothetical protein